jgi:hypothetical protein
VPFRVRAVVVIHTRTERERERLCYYYYYIISCLHVRFSRLPDASGEKRKKTIISSFSRPFVFHIFDTFFVVDPFVVEASGAFLALKCVHVSRQNIHTQQKK